MGIGTDLRDKLGFGRYVRDRILPLAPCEEPIPFRARAPDADEALTFLDEMDAWLRARPGAVWSVQGSPGFGKTLLARSTAVRWGRRFLEEPEGSPVPLWIEPSRLKALETSGATPELAPRTIHAILVADLPGPEMERLELERLEEILSAHPFIAVIDRDEDPTTTLDLRVPRQAIRVLHLSIGHRLDGPVVRLEPWDRDSVLLAVHRRLGPEGIECIEAIAASPVEPLLSYPLFVGHILVRGSMALEEYRLDGGMRSFLRWLHGLETGAPRDYPAWCEAVLVEPGRVPLSARKLHLAAKAGRRADYARVFSAYLLAELVREGRETRALGERLLDVRDLALLAAIHRSFELPGLLQVGGRLNETEATNRASSGSTR